MAKITQEQAIVITGYTGTICVEFNLFHADLERRLERTVSAYEIQFMHASVQAAYKKDFVKMFEEFPK